MYHPHFTDQYLERFHSVLKYKELLPEHRNPEPAAALDTARRSGPEACPPWEGNCPDWAVWDLASLGHVVKELDHMPSTDLIWSEAGAALNHRLGYYQES